MRFFTPLICIMIIRNTGISPKKDIYWRDKETPHGRGLTDLSGDFNQ